MALEKIYTPIGWQNKPSTATPLGSHNLSKIDEALAEIDERVVELSEDTEVLDGRVEDAETDITKNADDITRLDNRFTGFSTAMSQGMELLFDRVEEAEAKTEKNTEDINALKIIPTASGTTAYMDDASNMNLENIIFYGESTQLQTTGKNLLQNTAKTQTVNGVTFTINDDKSIKTSGSKTGTSNVICNIGTFTAKAGIDYVCSYLAPNDAEVADNYMQLHTADFSIIRFVTKISTISFEEDTVLNVRMIVDSTTGKTYYPMIRLASITDSTYEPYTGGKASPSPDHPQPIESKIVNRIDVCGTNQLPNELKSRTESGLTIDSTPERIKVTGTTLRGVTVSVCDTKIESKNGLFAKGATKLEGLSYVARVHNYSTGAMEYWVIGTKGRYVEPGWTIERVYIQQINADVTVDAEIQPQIVVGNVDLPFEPYQSQTVNLSAPIELNGFGGVRDTDKLKKFGVVVLDGSQTMILNSGSATGTSGSRRFQITCLSGKPSANTSDQVKANALCDQAIISTGSRTYTATNQDNIFSIENTFVCLRLSGIATLEDMKAHLQANPMTVVYELAEPIETALPQADIDAIKALHSYKPNTVVMNDADAEMNVSYVADAQLYIDHKFETLASAIVNQ